MDGIKQNAVITRQTSDKLTLQSHNGCVNAFIPRDVKKQP